MLEQRFAANDESVAFTVKRTYDANLNLTSVRLEDRGPDGPTGEFVEARQAYDACNDAVEEAVRLDARTWLLSRHEYDAEQNRVATTAPEGTVSRWEFDQRGLMVSHTRGHGTSEASTTRWEYDGRGQVTRVILPDGDAVLTSYDGHGRPETVTAPDGSTERRFYDASGKVRSVTRHGIPGGPTPEGNDTSRNVLLAQVDYDLDELYRVTAVREHLLPTGSGPSEVAVGRTEYDRLGRPVAMVEPDQQRTILVYDGLSRLVSRQDALGNRVEQEYDANSNVVRVREHEVATLPGVAPVELVTSVAYDALDRPTHTTDSLGRVSQQLYDSRGNVVRVLDPARNVTRARFDLAGRLVEEIRELRVGGVGDGALDTSNAHNPDGMVTIRYAYDRSSRLVAFRDDNGNQTSYEYDALDRRVAERYADGTSYTFAYDLEDNLTRVVDPNGTVVRKQYDSVNRLARVDVEPGPGVPGTTLEVYEYDGLSRLTRATGTEPSGRSETFARTFDSLSRLIADEQGGSRISHTYDLDGNRLATRYPGGRLIEVAYDALDRPLTRSDQNGLVNTFSYVGPGLRELRRTNADGTVQTLLDPTGTVAAGYDAGRRIRRLKGLLSGGSAFLDREYDYNEVDVCTAEIRHDDAARADRYAYDSLYRLVSTRYDQEGTPGAGLPSRATRGADYLLDGVGNRRTTELLSDAGQLVSYGVNELNQYTSVTTGEITVDQAYDSNGNLVRSGDQIYRYDYRNRLVEVARSTGELIACYSYDTENRRTRKAVYAGGGGATVTRFVYDDWLVAEEQDETGQTLATFLYGPGYSDEVVEFERTAAHPLGAGRFFTHVDPRGNVVAITRAAPGGGSEVAERRFYDDFGRSYDEARQVSRESVVGNPYGFQCHRLDPETGLVYVKNRYYDPETGRFLQRDPAVDPGNLGNAYSFAWNSPISRTDPDGEAVPVVAAMIIGAVAYGLFDVYAQYHTTGGFEYGTWDAHATGKAMAYGAFMGASFVTGGRGALAAGRFLVQRVGLSTGVAGFVSVAASGAVAGAVDGALGSLLDVTTGTVGENVGRGALYGAAFGVGLHVVGKVISAVGRRVRPAAGAHAPSSTPQCAGACFLAGTGVESRQGRVSVEEVRVGDEVLSRDDSTGEVAYKRVVRLFRGHTDRVVHLKIAKCSSAIRGRGERHRVGLASGGSGEGSDEPPLTGRSQADAADDDAQEIRCTTEHPFWVQGRGWVGAKDLRPGDELVGSKGERLVVVAQEVRQEEADHYNFEVEDFHTYFVAGDLNAPAVWVHNMCFQGKVNRLRQMRPGGVNPGSATRVDSGPAMRWADHAMGGGGGVVHGVPGRASSSVLGRNLEAAGQIRPANSAAHHLVAGNARRAAPARAVLAREGIPINSSANGIFLPRNSGFPGPAGVTNHGPLHTNRFYDAVNAELTRAAPGTARDVLDSIAARLTAGTFPY